MIFYLEDIDPGILVLHPIPLVLHLVYVARLVGSVVRCGLTKLFSALNRLKKAVHGDARRKKVNAA